MKTAVKSLEKHFLWAKLAWALVGGQRFCVCAAHEGKQQSLRLPHPHCSLKVNKPEYGLGLGAAWLLGSALAMAGAAMSWVKVPSHPPVL